MNSNEDELQKAINDITNNMLNETPVAPEGAVVQPAPTAEVAPVAPETPGTPPTVAPLPDAQNLQAAPAAAEAPASAEPAAPEAPATEPVAPVAEVATEVVAADIPDLSMPEPVSEPEPVAEPEAKVEEEPKEEEKPVEEVTMDFNEKMEVEPGGVKEKALRDLIPILGKMNNVDAEKKFKVYCDMIEALDEKDIANDAYEVATQIGDDNVRGEALLKLVDLLDK